MDFDLTPAQQDAYRQTLAAVRAELDGSDRFGRGDHLTRDEWRRAGKLGLLGLCVPEEYGGGGLGALDTAIRVAAFGEGCTDMGLVFAASAHLFACLTPLAKFGGDALKARVLPKLCSGELIAGNAMTEAQAGSDVSALAVSARREGEEYVLNGTKTFVSNAPVADVFITYATVNPKAAFLGVTCFAVPRNAPGLTVGEPFQKMGLTSCPAATVTFDDCRVPAHHAIGEEGQGSAIFQHSMGWERACLFAGYVGMMQRLIDRCVDHAKTRRQFKHPIAEFQAVSHKIADMRLRLDAARLLLHRACWQMDQGRGDPVAIALSKLAISEAVVKTAMDSVQIFGGRGYLSAGGIEESLRDAIGSTIFSGTSEIQRELVANGMGL
jgi:alkylation response protein AidB-like acyl-CoA dehydrogenase